MKPKPKPKEAKQPAKMSRLAGYIKARVASLAEPKKGGASK